MVLLELHNLEISRKQGEKTMIVSSGYRKNGFDAHGGKLLQKKDIVFTRLHKKNRKFRIDSNLTKICGYSYYFVKNILFISLSS